VLDPFLSIQAVFFLVVALILAMIVIRTFTRFTREISSGAMVARVIAIILTVICIGMGGGELFESVYPPLFAIIATGILTFFFFIAYAVRHAPDMPIKDSDMRIAITASITTMYLVRRIWGLHANA